MANRIVWQEQKCTSLAITPTGHKLTAEWVNDNRWIWFVQNGKGSVEVSYKSYGNKPVTREQAKITAYKAYLQLVK